MLKCRINTKTKITIKPNLNIITVVLSATAFTRQNPHSIFSGGFEFDISWGEGKLIAVNVTSLTGNKLILRYKNKIISRETEENEELNFGIDDFN